jgi:hypothetical protein
MARARTGVFMIFSPRHPTSAPPIPGARYQVQVGALDELLGLNSELCHEVTRFTNSLLGGFIVHQHDFELEKMAETFDAVEVNAGASTRKRVRYLRMRPICP